MSQADCHQPSTAEAVIQFQASLFRIYGGESIIGTGFSPSTWGFPSEYHPTCAP
jgi:hypothetical protein